MCKSSSDIREHRLIHAELDGILKLEANLQVLGVGSVDGKIEPTNCTSYYTSDVLLCRSTPLFLDACRC